MTPLRFSVSQSKTYSSCKRKWYLEKVAKLPVKFADSTTRGSILHEVLERWLLADDRGIDLLANKPVDLYPKDWHIKEERGQIKKISFEEQIWIQRIVPLAESMNILLRLPGRVVEHKFECELLPATDTLPPVDIVGYIDLAYDFTIGDHKSMRTTAYALNNITTSAFYIGNDVQLLTYCYYWAKHQESLGHKIPETMDVEHYQYPYEDTNKRKGRGTPQTTKATVTWARILENLETVKQVAHDLRQSNADWNTYEESERNLDACGAYGGCPFRALCSGQESVDMYTERTLYSIDPNLLQQKLNKTKEPLMGAFDKVLTKKKEAKTIAPAPAAATGITDVIKQVEANDAAATVTAKPALLPNTNVKVDFSIEELIAKITALESAGLDDMAGPFKEQLAKLEAEAAEKKAA